MGFRYVVLGAGRQGVACGYDLAKNGDAEEVIFADSDKSAAQAAALRVNELLASSICSATRVDVGSDKELTRILGGKDGVVSSVPYQFNLDITKTAIQRGCSMCDLGGHTGIVRQQREYHSQAHEKNISIIPDCGMGPGMNISLAVHAISLLDATSEVYIWDGGLPQHPMPPWNYELTFNIGGLLNEYTGSAYFLRDGKIVEVPCFEDYELMEFKQPLGTLEAFVTSGGLSTMPWTFGDALRRLENKTLRYPGHHAQFSALARLGLFDPEPVQIFDKKVVPRDVLATLLEPQVTASDTRDVCIIRVRCKGEKDGIPTEVVVELVDYYDKETGFTAMQRLTGWHAAIMLQLAVKGRIKKGVLPVETIPSEMVVEEAKARGFNITVLVTELE